MSSPPIPHNRMLTTRGSHHCWGCTQHIEPSVGNSCAQCWWFQMMINVSIISQLFQRRQIISPQIWPCLNGSIYVWSILTLPLSQINQLHAFQTIVIFGRDDHRLEQQLYPLGAHHDLRLANPQLHCEIRRIRAPVQLPCGFPEGKFIQTLFFLPRKVWKRLGLGRFHGKAWCRSLPSNCILHLGNHRSSCEIGDESNDDIFHGPGFWVLKYWRACSKRNSSPEGWMARDGTGALKSNPFPHPSPSQAAQKPWSSCPLRAFSQISYSPESNTRCWPCLMPELLVCPSAQVGWRLW